MKAKDAMRKFCPIRGTEATQIGDNVKVYNRKCSPGGCMWWADWPDQEEKKPDEQEGSCAVVDIAAAIEVSGNG